MVIKMTTQTSPSNKEGWLTCHGGQDDHTDKSLQQGGEADVSRWSR